MIEIVCPSCQARYQLPEGSIGSEGRKVSCSNCSHKWRAYAEGVDSEASPSADEPAYPPEPQMPEDASETAYTPEPPASAAPRTQAESDTVVEAQLADEAPSPPEPEAAPEPQSSPEPQSPPEPQVTFGSSAPIEPPASTPAISAGTAAAVSAFDSDSDAPNTTPPPAAGNRDEQMAAIRQMLSDLKDGADAEPELEPEQPRTVPAPPAPPMRVRPGDEEDSRDQLKSRIDQLSKAGRAAKGQREESGYNAAKLRRMHEKRAKKLQRSRERRKKSGAFLTGFTLVTLVMGTMVGLYILKPQIIASSPEMAPALNEYVVTVDRYRVELNETTAEWREWLVARFENLTAEEPKPE